MYAPPIVMIRIDKPGSIWHKHVQRLLSHSNFPRNYLRCVIDHDLISLIPIHDVGTVENCLLSEDYRNLYIFLRLNAFLRPSLDNDVLTFEHIRVPPNSIATAKQYERYWQ